MEDFQSLVKLWEEYVSHGDDSFTWEFVIQFIQYGQNKLRLDWKTTLDSPDIPSGGPRISELPGELLVCLSSRLAAFLPCQSSEDSFRQASCVLKVLIILSRNYDNIPLIASCDCAASALAIATLALPKVVTDGDEEPEDVVDYLKLCALFLELLYDPYLTWRKRRLKMGLDFRQLAFQPALLHPELIPFLYDCCEKDVVVRSPSVAKQFVHLLGAVVSGAQHNALKAICPATIHSLSKTIENAYLASEVAAVAMDDFVIIIHTLLSSKSDQCQMEMGQVVIEYVTSLQRLGEQQHPFCKEQDNLSVMRRAVKAMGLFLSHKSCEWLQNEMAKSDVVGRLISSIAHSPFSFQSKQTLAVDVVAFCEKLLRTNNQAKREFTQSQSPDQLFDFFMSLVEPSADLLNALMNFAIDIQSGLVTNPVVILRMLEWLPGLTPTNQIWLAGKLKEACGSSFPNKCIAAQMGLLGQIATVLVQQTLIVPAAVLELLKLVEILGCHSISTAELRLLIQLLNQPNFPWTKQVLSVLNSLCISPARSSHASHFFDIQSIQDGLVIPTINLWQSAGYGLTFFAWLRLDEPLRHTVNARRQIYSFQTCKQQSFEAFCLHDSTLVIGVKVKKEFITAMLPEPISDTDWHSLCVSHLPPKRPFGQNQLVVYFDGVMKMSISFKTTSLSEAITSCTVGAPAIQPRPPNPSAAWDASTARFLPQLVSQLPTYLSLPSGLGFKSQTDPKDLAVRVVPAGQQDTVWGVADALRGQLSSCMLWQEAAPAQYVKAWHEAGVNGCSFCNWEDEAHLDWAPKVVFCLCAQAYHAQFCADVSVNAFFDAQASSCLYRVSSFKDVLRCVGGLSALLPILELCAGEDHDAGPLFAFSDGKETFSLIDGLNEDWKWEPNVVAASLSLMRNAIYQHVNNEDECLRKPVLPLIGYLLQSVPGYCIDVAVLMAVQSWVEYARDGQHSRILQTLYQFVLFDLRIWARAAFHVRIGHVQYITNLIREDRKSFRKRFGVQYSLDAIRQYHSEASELSPEDRQTLRAAFWSIITLYLQKDITYGDITALTGFLWTVREEILVMECLDTLLSYTESKHVKDQFYLLALEPKCAELLYAIFLERTFGVELRTKVLKLILNILRTDKVYEKNKWRLRLEGIGFPGLCCYTQGLTVRPDLANLLLDIVLSKDGGHAYRGALAVTYALAEESLQVKLEAAKKILAFVFFKPNSPQYFVQQVSWQECLCRLLVKHSIVPGPNNSIKPMLSDLMQFDDSQDDLLIRPAPLSPYRPRPSSGSSARSSSLQIEPDWKEVAEFVSDNLQNVAGNLQSVVHSAYSVIKQKTIQVQENLEGLGENTLSRFKRRSQNSFDETDVSPRMTRFSNLFSLEMATDALSFDHAEEEELGNCVSLQSTPKLDRRQDSLDQDTVSIVSEVSGHWTGVMLEPGTEPQEELCQIVLTLLMILSWKGLHGPQAWKGRMQVLSCINLLGLSNELYKSHVELKRRLLEMMLQSVATDVRHVVPLPPLTVTNATNLIQWVYDLVVLDPHEDESKKIALKLVENTLTIIEALELYKDPDGREFHMALDILVTFVLCQDNELCAIVASRLHMWMQTYVTESDALCFVFYRLCTTQPALLYDTGRLAFIFPAIKAIMEKTAAILGTHSRFPGLNPDLPESNVYEAFLLYALQPEWKTFMEKDVRTRYEVFSSAILAGLPEAINRQWAESDEAIMVAVHGRQKQVAESKARFQVQVLDVFRARQNDEQNRWQATQSLFKSQNALLYKRWKQSKYFMTSRCGPWPSKIATPLHWKLSHYENRLRMRIKLVPNWNFDNHAQASKLRDNAALRKLKAQGVFVDHDPFNLPLKIAKQAVRLGQGEDSLADEDLALATAMQTLQSEAGKEGKEKAILAEDCELVTLMSVFKGKFELTSNHICFYDLSAEYRERQDCKWSLTQLKEVHLRRYNLRRSALEFFLVDQTNFFLNFNTKVRNKVYSRIIGLRPPNLLYHTSKSPAELLRTSGVTQSWLNREISNFDYLMQLNTIAGRTFNDLSQYPVFPWILADYDSEVLNLENPSTFRDLSKPMGVVNPKNAAEVSSKFDHFEDPSGTVAKFHYGTHYSNAAGVLHYLVRLEPFTSLHIELQSGRFDVADRQFHSLPSTWKMLMENPNDVKELIPEFFCLPELFVNMNNFDLGVLQTTKQRIDDVELPRWASSPEDFIWKHRQALESEYVSAHLHKWVDLIFGYKQRGLAAVEALNVFYYCSYEGAVDLDAISDPMEREAVEGMINHFGQTPCQLLQEPHPQRMPFSQAIHRWTTKPGDSTAPSLFFFPDWSSFPIQFGCESGDWAVFLSLQARNNRLSVTGSPEPLVSVTRSGHVLFHAWQPFDKHVPLSFTLEKDPTVNSSKVKRKLRGVIHPSLKACSQLVGLTPDGRFLVMGGWWDSSVRLYGLPKLKCVTTAYKHLDVITCLVVDSKGSYLMTGSKDSTCVLWELNSSGMTPNQVVLQPLHSLCGHASQVQCVAMASELDLAVSGSQDGTINVYTVKDGDYLRTLQPGFPVLLLTLSDLGHIVCTTVDKKEHKVHVYSVNGQNTGMSKSPFKITSLQVVSDYILTGDVNGDVIVRRLYGCVPERQISLASAIETMTICHGQSHVIVSCIDGTGSVITPSFDGVI